MKKINKDYISVVRNHSGKLHYERVPMRISDKVKSRLAAMADDDSKSIDDMKEYLSGQPIFKYMAAAYFEAPESINFSSLASWKMKDLADELRNSRTKAKFLENALNLIEESDYRWNVIRITGDMPDVILKSHSDSDSVVITVRVTEDTCIVFDSDDIEDFYSGILCYTVYKNDIPVLPYRSLVEMYRCSEDILDATKVFDPESSQFDNAFKSLTATANAIIQDEDGFFMKNVVAAGQDMLEKMKMMCLDPESYYNWLESICADVVIDYSECDRTLDSLYRQHASNKQLFELYSMGDKMNGALLLAENLNEWSKQGLVYSGLASVLSDLRSMAKSLLQKMEEAHDSLPHEVFAEFYGAGDPAKRQLGEDACLLRSACEKLRASLFQEQDFQNPELQ